MSKSLFCCPVCGGTLARFGGGYRCAKGHCYDISAQGYTNLLLANRKNSKAPGDDKAMSAARNRFLDGGYYAPLREKLCELAVEFAPRQGATLDSGCGEGYYTAGVRGALAAAGKDVRMAGIDISKFALRWAAKRTDEVEFAVASAYRLPLADGSVQLLLNCFSPLGLEEFARVLAPQGTFVYVVPGPRHLWELKQVLYETPYENARRQSEYAGFEYIRIDTVAGEFTLPDKQAIQDLFTMTPYCWKTPRAGREALAELDELRCRFEFDLHIFRRTE